MEEKEVKLNKKTDGKLVLGNLISNNNQQNLYPGSAQGSLVDKQMETILEVKNEKDEGNASQNSETLSSQGGTQENQPLRRKPSFLRLGMPLTHALVKQEVPLVEPPSQPLNSSPPESVTIPNLEIPPNQKFQKQEVSLELMNQQIKVENQDQFPQKVNETSNIQDNLTNKPQLNNTNQMKLSQEQVTFYDIGQNQVRLEEQYLANRNDKMKRVDSNDSIVYRLFGDQEHSTFAHSSHTPSPDHSYQSLEYTLTETTQFDRFSHFGETFNKLVNSLTWLSSLHLSCVKEANYINTYKNTNTYGIYQNLTTTNVNYQKNSPNLSVNYMNTQSVMPTNRTLSPRIQHYAMNINQQPTYTTPNYPFNEFISGYEPDNLINIDNDFNMDNNYNYTNPIFNNTLNVNQNSYEQQSNYNQGYKVQNYNQGYNSLSYENTNYNNQGYNAQNYGNQGQRSNFSYNNNYNNNKRHSNDCYKNQCCNNCYNNQNYKDHNCSTQGCQSYEHNCNHNMCPNCNQNNGCQNVPTHYNGPNQQVVPQKNYRGKYFYNNRVVNGVEQEVYDLDVDLGLTYSRTYY